MCKQEGAPEMVESKRKLGTRLFIVAAGCGLVDRRGAIDWVRRRAKHFKLLRMEQREPASLAGRTWDDTHDGTAQRQPTALLQAAQRYPGQHGASGGR
jgi:hypothetical protein